MPLYKKNWFVNFLNLSEYLKRAIPGTLPMKIVSASLGNLPDRNAHLISILIYYMQNITLRVTKYVIEYLVCRGRTRIKVIIRRHE